MHIYTTMPVQFKFSVHSHTQANIHTHLALQSCSLSLAPMIGIIENYNRVIDKLNDASNIAD